MTDQQPPASQSKRTNLVGFLPQPIQGYTREFLRAMRRADTPMLAVQMAYSILFSLAPVFILTLALGALLERYTGVSVASYLQDTIVQYAPVESQDFLLDLVDEAIVRINPGFASLSALLAVLLALWGSMSGMSTLIMASNRAYQVRETRSFVRRRLTILLLAVLVPLLMIITITLIFWGSELGHWLNDNTGVHFLTSNFIRALLSVLVVAAGLLLLYQIAPNVDHRIKWSLPGTFISTLLILGLLLVSRFVLERLSIGTVYGAASSIVILLYLFRVIGYIYISGAGLNSVLSQSHDSKRRLDMQMHPEKMLFTEYDLEIESPFGWVEQRIIG